jgi:hypothetical protein
MGKKSQKQKSQNQGTNQTLNRVSFGGTMYGNTVQTFDYRTDAKTVAQASVDGVVSRCIQLIVNSTLSGGYRIKTENPNHYDLLDKVIKQLDFITNSKFLLNSILGTGGDVVSYLYLRGDGEIGLNCESTFWQGSQRLKYTINPATKKIEGNIEVVKNGFQNLKELDSTKVFFFQSPNIANDYLGLTPLMVVTNKVIEKQRLSDMNSALALRGGKLDGILAPKESFLKDLDPNRKIDEMIETQNAVEVLAESNSGMQNFAIVSLPLEYTKIEATNHEMQLTAVINQINYEICASFGVPPSLVQFSDTTDPNLSNASQYRDNFAELNTNDFKNKLEVFWRDILHSMYPEIEFEFFVSREETDESVLLRDQFRATIDDCIKLQSLGVDALPDFAGLEKLGIVINHKESQESTIVDAMETSTKTLEVKSDVTNVVYQVALKDATKPKKKIQWRGKTIAIQYSIGDLRHGKKMHSMYGYLENHKGEDSMALDVYIGSNIDSNFIFKVKQIDPKTKELDEWKFMIGFKSQQEALDYYLKQIPKRYFGGVYYSSISEIDKYKVTKPVMSDESLAETVKAPSDVKNLPTIDRLESSKGYKQFKAYIHDNIKSQLDSMFSSLTKMSRYSDQPFYQEIFKNLPQFKLGEAGLIESIKKNLLPNILEQYNDFYKSDFKLDDLPFGVEVALSDIAKLTITGDSKNYLGINETTATAVTNTLQNILAKTDQTLEDYQNLNPADKVTAYTQARQQGRNIILQNRTDLLTEMIANNTFNEVYDNLAKSDIGTDNIFVGMQTQRDNRVRDTHKLLDSRYFNPNTLQPWKDFNCRCTRHYSDENSLILLGYSKL